MTKLTRFVQKIFGDNSGVDQVSVFGSLSEAVPEFSKDPKAIQKLAAYDNGWFSAVFGNKSPTIEDRNSLDFLFSYQLSYLMQQGVPEWDVDTTYYTGQICSSNGVLYKSLIDDNLNNPISETDKWENISQGPLVNSQFKNFRAHTAVADKAGNYNGAGFRDGQVLFLTNDRSNSNTRRILRSVNGYNFGANAQLPAPDGSGVMDYCVGTTDYFLAFENQFGSLKGYRYSPTGDFTTWSAYISLGTPSFLPENAKQIGDKVFIYGTCSAGPNMSIMKSDDSGVNFTEHTLPGIYTNWSDKVYDMYYFNGAYYLVILKDSDGTVPVFKSTDGAVWTQVNADMSNGVANDKPNSSQLKNSFVVGNGMVLFGLVAGDTAPTGRTVLISTDGENFTPQYTSGLVTINGGGFDSRNVVRFAFAESWFFMMVQFSGGGGELHRSKDGINWERLFVDFTGTNTTLSGDAVGDIYQSIHYDKKLKKLLIVSSQYNQDGVQLISSLSI